MDVTKIANITEGLPLVQYKNSGKGQLQRIESNDTSTVDVVNRQAWEVVEQKINEAHAKVTAGRASILYYYMTVNQMDPALLAKYMGISRWRVKRHLKPGGVDGLSPQLLAAYAQLFQIDVEDLRQGIFQSAIYEK